MLRLGLSRRAQTVASVLGIFIALVSVATPHASERDASASAEKISLNGTWQFALAPTKEEAQALENFSREGFDVSDFKATPVPSNWESIDDDCRVKRPEANRVPRARFQYPFSRRHPSVSHDIQCPRTVRIEIDRLRRRAVYCNGIAIDATARTRID